MESKKEKFYMQLLLLFIFLLPFGFRHIFNYEDIAEMEFFKEGLSLSFYLFDGVFLLLIWENIISKRNLFPFKKNTKQEIVGKFSFWLITCFLVWSSFYIAQYFYPAFYLSLRLIQGLVIFIIVGGLIAKNKEYFRKIIYLIFISGVLQAILGIWQFLKQGSIGLSLMGESKIAPDILGVAKFELAGEKFIRAYGTFPHPNLFGAFLFLSLVCGLSFLFFYQGKIPFDFNFPGKNKLRCLKIGKKKLSLIHYSSGLLLLMLGILLSYSRSVWIVSFVVVFIFFWKYFKQFSEEYFKKTLFEKVKIAFFVIIVLTGAGIYPIIAPRLCIDDCAGDQSFSLRQKYTHFALEKIDDNKYFGVGTSGFVLQMRDKKPLGLKEWEIQPVHNLYLLVLAEIGVVGLTFLLFTVLVYLKRFREISGNWNKTGLYAIYGFLALGLFDHYFWTTPQGIIIFWLAIALIAGSCKIKGGIFSK